VTGTDGTATGTATLTVTAAGLHHLALAPATATIGAGTAQAYTATGFDAYGNSLGDVTAATGLTISPNGAGTGASCNNSAHTCTAAQAGTYTVTGTDGTATGTATLTVTAAGLAHLGLSPSMTIIAAGTTQNYTIAGQDQAGNSLGDLTAATSLSIAPNGAGTGATCDNTAHTCTATRPGTYTVTGKDGPTTTTATLWVGPHFTQQAGLASALSIGRNGSVWILGTTPVPGGYPLYQWNGHGWSQASVAALKIAVDPNGNPWTVDSAHHIRHYNGKGWVNYSGAATDISVGANGSVWILGTNRVPGGYAIYHWTAKGWTAVSGGATHLAVDPSGNAWSVDSAFHIRHYNGQGWVNYSGAATDISVAANGTLWVTGTNPAAGGYGIYLWENRNWTLVMGAALKIAADPTGNHPWVINSNHQVFSS
jgi:hypothetical protein